MSYVVQLWEYPEPRTLQGADSIHNMLAGQRSRPNPKWRLLAELDAAQAAASGIQRVEVRGKELRGMSALMVIPIRSTDWISIGGSLRTQAHVDRLIEGLFEYYDQELLRP